jgi:hypothetical protein
MKLTFLPGLAWNLNPLISASQIAEIIGVSHRTQPYNWLLLFPHILSAERLSLTT